METKHMSMQSQTVRCHHCGEFYSVTYKFCPFCDAARQEEERRVAEKKKQRQAMLGSFLNGQETDRRKSNSGAQSRRSDGDPSSHRAPAKKEGSKTRESLSASSRREASENGAGKVTPFYRKDGRKKTSEMTPEERAAHLAEREARAAERKRAREQAAREAALAAGTVSGMIDVPTDPTPVFEDDSLPETFGLEKHPDAENGGTIFKEISPNEETNGEQPQDVMEVIPLYLTPDGLQKETPVAQPAEPEAEVPAAQDFLQEMAQGPEDSMVLVMGQAETGAEEMLVVQTEEEGAAASVQAENQPTPAAEQPLVAAPQAGIPGAGEELDSLLSEIRDMLAESPIPDLAAEQLKTPPKPVAQVEISQPVAPAEAPVPAEPVSAAPAPKAEGEESPTIVLPAETIAKAAEAAQEVPAAVEAAVDDAPTQVIPRQRIQQEEEGPEILPAVAVAAQGGQSAQEGARQTAETPEKTVASANAQSKTKQKSGIRPLLLVLSLILIAAAAFIVVKTVVPAFQDGLFSQGQEKDTPADTAASFTLEKGEITVAEEGQTFTLTPIFDPEGSTAAITWTSSDEAVATVDETGLVSAIAPGTATITGTMASGYSVQCVVTCSWNAQGDEATAGTEPAADLALSASTMTLNEAGASKQLQVTGAVGAVTWTSSAPDIATVAEDGTVTAVAKGGASVTAEVDGKTLTCEVKCIW